jgi:hypothetical protein
MLPRRRRINGADGLRNGLGLAGDRAGCILDGWLRHGNSGGYTAGRAGSTGGGRWLAACMQPLAADVLLDEDYFAAAFCITATAAAIPFLAASAFIRAFLAAGRLRMNPMY